MPANRAARRRDQLRDTFAANTSTLAQCGRDIIDAAAGKFPKLIAGHREICPFVAYNL
jgi:hypothetical protein